MQAVLGNSQMEPVYVRIEATGQEKLMSIGEAAALDEPEGAVTIVMSATLYRRLMAVVNHNRTVGPFRELAKT